LRARSRPHKPGGPTYRLETACRKAIEAGDPSYRTIKGILALGIEDERVPHPRGDGGAAAFLHGPEQLFALPAMENTARDNLVSVLPTATAIDLETTNAAGPTARESGA